MAYSDTDKAEFFADSFRSTFKLNQDIVNTSIINIFNTEIEHFLNTNNSNILKHARFPR